MAQTSVAQFASELKVPPSVLIEQLRAAGVDKKQANDSLSEQDKSRLLEYLRKTHGSRGDQRTRSRSRASRRARSARPTPPASTARCRWKCARSASS